MIDAKGVQKSKGLSDIKVSITLSVTEALATLCSLTLRTNISITTDFTSEVNIRPFEYS